MLLLFAAFVGMSNDSFSFPKSTELGVRKTAFFSHYYVYSAKATAKGVPVLTAKDVALGANLSPLDFCLGGMEGTVRVTMSSGKSRTFNVVKAGSALVDCTTVKQPNGKFLSRMFAGTGRSRFIETSEPFGLGIRNYRLVPYRSMARKDALVLPGTVIYVPALREKMVTLPSGAKIAHDGYLFAADTGSRLKNTQIDLFTGVMKKNELPHFVTSKNTDQFPFYVIEDPEIKKALRAMHVR
jgi:3D (Asp-Asp-Asp) domain-containing protein